MKSTFTLEDFDRALGNSFFDSPLMIRTFEDIFSQYTPESLEGMSQAGINKLAKKLSRRADVLAVQRTLEQEVAYGEQTMHEIEKVLLAIMKKVGVMPLDGKRMYNRPYQEAWAYCGDSPHLLAKGIFHSDIPLEKIVFAPENSFYSDVPHVFKGGALACDGELDIRRVAGVNVYRDQASDEELVRRVKQIIHGTANRVYNGSIKSDEKRYATAERDIINDLGRYFPSITQNGRIDYRIVYKIFEGVRRENFNLDQLILNPDTRSALLQQITSNIPLPYALVRRRVKIRERLGDKVIQALYDLKNNDEIESEKRMSASVSIFGAQIDMENYGPKRTFLGMTKTRVSRGGDEIKIRTEIYDENRKLLYTTDEMPDSYSDFSGTKEFTLPR